MARATTTAPTVERFEGFSDDALQFLLELQAEQSRVWFKAHQAEFTRLCRRPLELLVEELRERLTDVYPGLADSEPHYLRIQRDTRFARDKLPYKTNVAANLSIRPPVAGEDRHAVPGLYLSFGLEGEFVAVGRWYMPPADLARYRMALADERTGPRIQEQVAALRARGFTLGAMEQLKRVPPPYAQDHPRAELLKLKGLAVSAQPSAEIAGSRALVDWAADHFRAAAPMLQILDEVVPAGG